MLIEDNIENEKLKYLENEIINLNQNLDKNKLKDSINWLKQIKKVEKEYYFTNIGDIQNEFRNHIKNNLDNAINRIKLICLMKFANNFKYGYFPRDIQLISLYFFINKSTNEGLIQEIKTGEGKSLIISFLAVYNHLVLNKKIDIITSSMVLAKRDYSLFKDFYEIFDVTTDFCRDDLEESNQYKKCYSSDILYGDCLNFEADILRVNFLGISGRKLDRDFQCVIIDEIDNICIDNIKNLTELLNEFPGYKCIEFIYCYIYRLLIDIERKEKLIPINKEEIISKLTDEFESFINQNKKENFKSNYYPKFLHDYIVLRKKEWCRNAFEAKYEYRRNKQYKISENLEGIKVIKPIDYFNTGVIQQNSVWTGLQQFLELKEGLQLTPENINSCYMSNLTFFKKYITNKGKKSYNNIYGLTGTLGSYETQLALNKIYNMKFIILPTYKQSKLKNPNYTIMNKHQLYIEYIIKEIKEYSKKRAVLVIFEFIENIEEIKSILDKDSSIEGNIIIYKDNENPEEASFLEKDIEIGNIILSTNLAARGTDIKISKLLDKEGGLHIILTYFPINERIEKQALGRAGRKGENGSGELIIFSSKNIEKLKNNRNEEEKKLYNHLMQNFSIRDELYENLFNRFCQLLMDLRNDNTINISIKDNLILDLKEKWGLFLIKNNINNVNGSDDLVKEVIECNFKIFENDVLDIKSGKKYNFRNPLIETTIINYENLKKVIEECNMYSLGANYFIIYLLIQSNQKIEYIKYYTEELLKNIKSFIFHLEYNLKNMIKEILNYEKSKFKDIYNQINEKIKIFEFFNGKIDFLYKIINHKIENPEIKIKIGKKINIDKNININGFPIYLSHTTIDYITDLGIYFFYEIIIDEGKVSSFLKNYCNVY